MPEDWTTPLLKPPPTTTGREKKLIQLAKCSMLTTLSIAFNSLSSEFLFSSWAQLTSSGKSFTYSSSHPSGLGNFLLLGRRRQARPQLCGGLVLLSSDSM